MSEFGRGGASFTSARNKWFNIEPPEEIEASNIFFAFSIISGCVVIKRLMAQEGTEPLRSIVITRVTFDTLELFESPAMR